MASSAFSFHCMICFEEFDPQTNYPVVLPCGHTYVCVECANRLDKCMECRTPLTIKVEAPPPPPPGGGGAVPPSTPGPNRNSGGGGGGGAGLASSPDVQKENMNYADRVRNSPGFRRRYGHLHEYNSNGSKRGGPAHGAGVAPTPPPQVVKQRLPLPKNAVLLSLIQASEPARRRAEVEAPPTPARPNALDGGGGDRAGSETPSPGGRGGQSCPGTLPKFSKPSPLFLDGSSSGDQGCNIGEGTSASNLVGSVPDDEDHKIRVGTYLEGGPCGTYAVAVKGGLLVYPTLFEHTLPSALNGLRQEEDVVKRDVEELVKKHRASAGTRTFPGNPVSSRATNDSEKNEKVKEEERKRFDANGSPITTENKTLGGGAFPPSPVDTEIGVSHTWVECHDEDENVEARCATVEIGSGGGDDEGGLLRGEGDSGSGLLLGGEDFVSPLHSPAGADIPMIEDAMDNAEGGSSGGDSGEAGVELSAFDDIAAMAAAASEEKDDRDEVRHGLSVSLTISEDDESDEDGGDGGRCEVDASTRTLPARRSQSIAGFVPRISSPHKDDSCATVSASGGGAGVGPVAKKFVRHFSQGSYPNLAQKKKRNPKNKEGVIVDEFDRPLIRLKYGDRVQVVSMDSRGWVKLARGYGYIRLENDKQLVKVGGTSDKACQIEAMLHELSIERNRLKHEQTKLELLSAGLMIDLQSSLITSDDHVVVPAPEGTLLRSESELSLSLMGTGGRIDTSNHNISLDDIDVSTRSKSILTPPRSSNEHTQVFAQSADHTHREIRTAKSHSPGRTSSLAQSNKAPPSPPYGQVTGNMSGTQHNSGSSVNTPTRVNFRSGLSGHRALNSSHCHPHDFLENRAYRSMSNHSGISSSKKATNSRGRSIY
mmetsp:Transcript_30684/g.65194  ORF Transcript_30684/g.65194 Transcript_30684/m.65194 type:complete len:879 (+) Transcript_30684:81-2717(+)